MSRSGLKDWHKALCGWCDRYAKGDAIYSYDPDWRRTPGNQAIASCGRPGHGTDFEKFPPSDPPPSGLIEDIAGQERDRIYEGDMKPRSAWDLLGINRRFTGSKTTSQYMNEQRKR